MMPCRLPYSCILFVASTVFAKIPAFLDCSKLILEENVYDISCRNRNNYLCSKENSHFPDPFRVAHNNQDGLI